MTRAARAALLTVAVAAAGCGAQTPPQDLHTPGVTPQSHPGVAIPSPTPAGEPVTRAEIAVIRGWSEAVRAGRVEEATRYFAVPATIENGATVVMRARKQLRLFNRTLRCGAKLLRWERGPHRRVVATFTLTQRRGGNCSATPGTLAAVAFLIRHRRIEQWRQVAVPVKANPDVA
ncbi:MAG TPA: hypothetical protein VH418_13395 [Solirubrobacteraceae bacterium]